jgi:hypothetical protein
MDRLPCELIHHILWYIDQPLDLFRMSCVCSRWQSFIMNEEYFLNQWFSQSLKRSQESYSSSCFFYTNHCRVKSVLNNLDQSSIPFNLRSTSCDLIPWIVSRHSFNYEGPSLHSYSLLLFGSSYSFSFWLFLPHECEFHIRIGNFNDNDLPIKFCALEEYYFDDGEHISIVDQWTHIVLNKIDSQSKYRIRINGRCVLPTNQDHLSFIRTKRNSSLINSESFHKFDNNPLEPSSNARITDLTAFKRCLTLVEIRAIYQQQALIKQIKVGAYINSNKIHTIEVGRCCLSNYFSYKCIFFLFIVFLIFLIYYFL